MRLKYAYGGETKMADVIEFTPDAKFRAIEIAERTVAHGYTQGGQVAGFRQDNKDMGEIIVRAERIMAWVAGDTKETDTAKLLDKLRGVLCTK